MSFQSYETSRQKGEVTTLYHFYYLNGQQFYLTDAERPVTINGIGEAFQPTPIQHGKITSSGTLDKANLEIRMPQNSLISESFRAYPPSDVVNCIVRQMHRDDPAQEALVVWSGRILSAGWEGNELKLTCEPISTALRRTGLRRHYQLGCPLVLYGAQCAASRVGATTPAVEVAAVSGSTATLPPGWLPGGWPTSGRTIEKFVGGVIEWDITGPTGPATIKRTILNILGGQNVVMTGKPTGLVAGMQVRLVLGCNHLMSDCKTVHNNVKNYGGQPFIPIKTPFGFSNNYY
jgi:hypothetical protein